MGDCLARLRKERLRVAGLMSGTSADGVDAAIVDIAPGRARVVAFATIPYRPALRRQVLDLAPPARALFGSGSKKRRALVNRMEQVHNDVLSRPLRTQATWTP